VLVAAVLVAAVLPLALRALCLIEREISMTDSISHTIHVETGSQPVFDVAASNPVSRDVPPCVLTIFGATGDLTRRKLIPAIYNLAALGLLPEGFAIVGFGRSAREEADFRANLKAGVQEFARLSFKEDVWQKLEGKIFYQRGAYGSPEAHAELEKKLNEIDKQFSVGPNRMYYLATPPEEFDEVIENVGALKKKAGGGGWRRLIVEKPFGQDLPSAQALNSQLSKYFRENEVFRIDHYLGKETVQNILALRFANSIWEPIWNNRYIDHLQIVVAEEVGVGRRGGYYETNGALRDMVVNHMMQVLSLVCMEPPVALDANAIRDEKVKVLRAIRPFTPEQVLHNTVRGQYEGYREEEGVDPSSKTETYVALKLMVDNWRWSGVPIYLRHGKALAKRATEVVIRWKDTPYVLFNNQVNRVKSNMLIMRIQPNDGFALRTNSKVPGSGMEIRDVQMDFDYSESYGGESPEAYERLLQDAMLGDGTLFTRRDEAEVAWSIADPILDTWQGKDVGSPFTYTRGSWGPEEADEFLAQDRRRWHQPQILPSKKGELAGETSAIQLPDPSKNGGTESKPGPEKNESNNASKDPQPTAGEKKPEEAKAGAKA
jgi:glucose-6-phosphate 1-dehydrogenase